MQELLANIVDLWWIDLTEPVDADSALLLLDDQERSRAGRLRQPRHRRQYISSHVELRQILAKYLRGKPEDIVFGQGERGKPFVLDGADNASPLQFNLSHSGDAALVGVSQASVGVDVEQRRTLTDSLSMARRFFSEKEFIFLQSLHESERAIAFLNHWVCKEAYVKATGEGLVDQLHRVEVELAEGKSASWSALPQGDCQDWQLQLLRPTEQTVAAVVVQQQSPLQLRWMRSPKSS